MLAVACSSDELNDSSATTDNVGNGAIELSAGIVESSKTLTRAGAEDNHDATPTYGGHKNLATGTVIALQVRGTWTGNTPVNVEKETTATVGGVTGADDLHNSLTCLPVLYWDDYGSAAVGNYNPASPTDVNDGGDPPVVYGRGVGLTIYGAAVNNKTTLSAAGLSSITWTALGWTLPANQSEVGSQPADKDLLVSNNVRPGTGDGTYKFDARLSGKLLEFRHAMSKITVNLQAGEGFSGSFTSTEVKLVNKKGTTTGTDSWALTTGTVDITDGTVSAAATPQVITMHHNTSATPPTGYHAVHEALVVPGSAFKKDATIARIKADDNIYYITSEEIRDAINPEAHDTDDLTESGKNYIINVVVNKTKILVNATIADWTEVTAATEYPKINITASFANPDNIRYDQFSFYRSEYNNELPNINDGYTEGGLENEYYYKPASRITYNSSTNDYTWDPQRYWSTHKQHYQFRLVWPRATTTDTDTDPYHPHVETKEYDGKSCQVIKIENEQYEPLYIDAQKALDDNTHHPYPSNLMIARPEVPDDYCTNNEPGHVATKLYSEGICAREGYIDLKFEYVMSQVEVNLTTTDDETSVNLAGAQVEITNIYSKGYVKLGDREVKTDGAKGSYTMTLAMDNHATLDVNESLDANKRHCAIVPQELTYTTPQASTNVQFRIVLANGDVYYADVKPILETGKSTAVAPSGAWESGYHYIYTLKISKTAIKVNATLADWTTVKATQDVWF